MSTSDLRLAPAMWWYADLPTALDGASAAEAPSEFAQGEHLLEWILPSLRAEVDDALEAERHDPTIGADRRTLRRLLEDDA
jgi:hypothetical protein